MNIGALVVEEAFRHLTDFGFVKNMDPMALEILKKSEDPLVRGMRGWMRREALKQAREAELRQRKMNEEFAQTQRRQFGSIEKQAVIDPYYTTKAVLNGHAWGDKKFVNYIKRENPRVFPKRGI